MGTLEIGTGAMPIETIDEIFESKCGNMQEKPSLHKVCFDEVYYR